MCVVSTSPVNGNIRFESVFKVVQFADAAHKHTHTHTHTVHFTHMPILFACVHARDFNILDIETGAQDTTPLGKPLGLL